MDMNKIYSFELPKCSTCKRYERLRQHRGVCPYLLEQGYVTIETIHGEEDLYEPIEGNVQLAPLADFGCRFHTDFIRFED